MRTRLASPLPYEWNCGKPDTRTCVYKLWFGTYYYIGLAKDIYHTLAYLSTEIDRRCRLGVNKDHVYFNIIEHVKSARVTKFKVDIIMVSNDAVALLKEFTTRLKSTRGDEKCLNTGLKPHIPTWIQPTDIALYNEWLKPKKNAAKNTKTLPARGNSRKDGNAPSIKRRSASPQRDKASASTIKEEPKGNNKIKRR